jgi:hypothetical protein
VPHGAKSLWVKYRHDGRRLTWLTAIIYAK